MYTSDETRPASKSRRAWLAQRFHGFCVKAVARLPWRLNRIVAPTFVGFALINVLTFGSDLLLLTALHGGLNVPLPIALTAAYVCALTLSYLLNRVLNFRSHAQVRPEVLVYTVAVAVNYLVFILGVSTVLTAVGLDYQVARIVAGGCEAVYMYSAMRWVVFRRKRVANRLR
ncbi:GtrA family protein [Mycobacterium sp.]|uniref:GtrA family protein n=1 Tax=Mycobacterium sp. TaxID=1785 RepID=UPI003BA9BCA4